MQVAVTCVCVCGWVCIECVTCYISSAVVCYFFCCYCCIWIFVEALPWLCVLNATGRQDEATETNLSSLQIDQGRSIRATKRCKAVIKKRSKKHKVKIMELDKNLKNLLCWFLNDLHHSKSGCVCVSNVIGPDAIKKKSKFPKANEEL